MSDLTNKIIQGSVVATMALDARLRALAASILRAADFVGVERELFQFFASQGKSVDYAALQSTLGKEALARYQELQGILAMSEVPGEEVFRGWLDTLRSFSGLRRIRAILQAHLSTVADDSNPKTLSAAIMSDLIVTQTEHEPRALLRASDVAQVVKDKQKAWEDGEHVDKVKTMFGSLDVMLGGLHRGHLCIIGAEPGMGKTQLLIQIARNVALHNVRVKRDAAIMLFSAEMTETSIIERLAQCVSGVPTVAIEFNKANEEQKKAWLAAVDEISKLAIYIDPSPDPTLEEMMYKVSLVASQHADGVDLIGLDFLQLVGEKGENENLRLARIMRGLKKIARYANAACIALSQLTKEAETSNDRLPRVHHLRASGWVRMLAQQVILFMRPAQCSIVNEDGEREYESPGVAKLAKRYGDDAVIMDVAKNRDGATGRVSKNGMPTLKFKPEITRFFE